MTWRDGALCRWVKQSHWRIATGSRSELMNQSASPPAAGNGWTDRARNCERRAEDCQRVNQAELLSLDSWHSSRSLIQDASSFLVVLDAAKNITAVPQLCTLFHSRGILCRDFFLLLLRFLLFFFSNPFAWSFKTLESEQDSKSVGLGLSIVPLGPHLRPMTSHEILSSFQTTHDSHCNSDMCA